jgi:inner membrane protein
MTGPTHVAFACLISYTLDFPEPAPFLVAVGSFLPDLDHPRSMIGRALPFISNPLSKLVAHRSWTHSLLFWVPFTVFAFFLWPPLGWLSIGAISHFLLDTLNTGGVQLMAPYSEKIFVCFSSRFRFPVSSPTEFIFCGVMTLCAFGAYHLQQAGGIRQVLAHQMGSYDIAVQHYKSVGTRVCWINGDLRDRDGQIKSGKFLVVGTTGLNGLAVYDSERKRVFHTPKEAEFLFTQLIRTENYWHAFKAQAPQKVRSGSAFFSKDGNKWHHGRVGDVISGFILHDGNLELESILDALFSDS